MHNDVNDLIRRYVKAAIGYGEGIHEGDSKLSDKHFDQIERLFQEIKSLKIEGLDEIAKLLQHDVESVRLWASSHLLNYPKYESYKVLESIINSGTILGLTAEVTLDQWKQGKISY